MDQLESGASCERASRLSKIKLRLCLILRVVVIVIVFAATDCWLLAAAVAMLPHWASEMQSEGAAAA